MPSDHFSAPNAYAGYFPTSNCSLTDGGNETCPNDDDTSDVPVLGPGSTNALSDPRDSPWILNGLAPVDNVSTVSSFSSVHAGLELVPFRALSQETVFPMSTMQYLMEEEFAMDDLLAGSTTQESHNTDNAGPLDENAFLTVQRYVCSDSDGVGMPSGGSTGRDAQWLGRLLNKGNDIFISSIPGLDREPVFNQFETSFFETLGDYSASGQLTQDYQSLMSSNVNVLPWDTASAGGITRSTSDTSVTEYQNPSSSSSSRSYHHLSTQRLHITEPSSPRPPTTAPDAGRRSPSGEITQRKTDQKPAMSGEFVIMTPATIGADFCRPTTSSSSSDYLERIRTTQRGRKGPLKNEIKTSALQVRKVGACYWCRLRKVRCDMERPCKHCKRLQLQVPQALCWQFPDFLPFLFPDFIRAHLKRETVAQLLASCVQDDTLNGVEQSCEIHLSSHPRFASVLKVQAKFFTAKDRDALLQWHLITGAGGTHLRSYRSVPLFLGFCRTLKLDQLRESAKGYVDDLIQEPAYAERVTDSFTTTELPTKILAIVRNFALKTNSIIIGRTLSIYTQHYIMTRHLCLSRESIISLEASGVVPQDDPWVTCRILARQIKCLIDELMRREVVGLYGYASHSLKSRDRQEWAPCLATVLILCLLIEAIEMAVDNFVVAQMEIHERNQMPCKFWMNQILEACRGLENMPFKQTTSQFHYRFQSHSKDASMRGFNPFVDGSWIEQGLLEEAEMEMVTELRELLFGENWQELQFLANDDMILNMEKHPLKMDRSLLYAGRLVAKFLISFFDETILSESRI